LDNSYPMMGWSLFISIGQIIRQSVGVITSELYSKAARIGMPFRAENSRGEQ
jgi:hypothetical protein